MTVKQIKTISLILHIFVGLGAMMGGTFGLLSPYDLMGVPASEVLKNAPFDSFIIPCIILFVVIGLGNIASAIFIKTKFKFQGYVSGVFGAALVIWIIVQCIMLQAIVFLHVLFFIIGGLQSLLALLMLLNEEL